MDSFVGKLELHGGSGIGSWVLHTSVRNLRSISAAEGETEAHESGDSFPAESVWGLGGNPDLEIAVLTLEGRGPARACQA